MTARKSQSRDDGLAISEVSAATGVPVPTLISWERRYGFPEPARTGGGHRRYSIEQVDQICALVELLRFNAVSRAVALLRGLDRGSP